MNLIHDPFNYTVFYRGDISTDHNGESVTRPRPFQFECLCNSQISYDVYTCVDEKDRFYRGPLFFRTHVCEHRFYVCFLRSVLVRYRKQTVFTTRNHIYLQSFDYMNIDFCLSVYPHGEADAMAFTVVRMKFDF